jgi:homoserine O-acetyltransferase
MRQYLTTALIALWAATTVAAEMKPEPIQHEFLIREFKIESGVTLPGARVVYGTYGKLNEARDNVVLLPSHYMAEMHGYEWLIGPGKALDPTKLFLVASELFGNGRSSSPSSTAEPFHGPRFPVMTIRDNVEAVHRMLTEELGVKHIKAVVGFSMGAQQAFQWAVSYPDYMDRIVATAGTAKTYGHGTVRLESEIVAITTDPTFNGGSRRRVSKRSGSSGPRGSFRRSGGAASSGAPTLRSARISTKWLSASRRTSSPTPTRTI